MFFATMPFIFAVQGLFKMYEQSNNQITNMDVFKLIITPILFGASFVIVISIIDIAFSSKRDFMIGTDTGLIAQFWSYDFYEKALSYNADNVKDALLKWLYGASAIVKIGYPLIIMFLFFYYFFPIAYKTYSDKDRELSTINSGSKAMTLSIAIFSVSLVAILVFVAYSALASQVMFHKGAFVPITSLGYAMKLGFSEVMSN